MENKVSIPYYASCRIYIYIYIVNRMVLRWVCMCLNFIGLGCYKCLWVYVRISLEDMRVAD